MNELKITFLIFILSITVSAQWYQQQIRTINHLIEVTN